jgi:hypothetical protein
MELQEEGKIERLQSKAGFFWKKIRISIHHPNNKYY